MTSILDVLDIITTDVQETKKKLDDIDSTIDKYDKDHNIDTTIHQVQKEVFDYQK